MPYKAQYGYDFYFQYDGTNLFTFPVTPSELTISVGSNNSVITLINEGDINVLKSPSLTEISFDARFPMRKVPYSREPYDFETIWNTLNDLKHNKKSFRFIVARNSLSGRIAMDTNLLVALEDFEIKESADEGDDIIISFNLKQYKEYGVKTLPSSYLKKTTSTSAIKKADDGEKKLSDVYTVQNGDCLWNIAKAAYNSGAKYTKIYNANKEAIEADAKRHGKSSSSNGHWIWAGLELTIPDIEDASKLKVKKL